MRISESEEITLLDLLSIISFCVGLKNLDLNITEQDITSQTQELDRKLRMQVADIHKHLQMQDEKLNHIIEVMENDKN